MRLAPIGLPRLPYKIELYSDASSTMFIMNAKVRQTLKIDQITFGKKTLRFNMITNNDYSSLSRSIEMDCKSMSLPDKISFVNEYLCQTAFQLNALRGNGYAGYVVIPELEDHSLISSSSNGKDKTFDGDYKHGTNGMKYNISKKGNVELWSLYLTDGTLTDIDITQVPWQVVKLYEDRNL